MGYGFEIKCKECDYSQNFYLGIGMMYFPLKNVINEENIKDKKLRQKLLDIIDNHEVTESNYGHELYRCEKCDKLYRKFYVELHYDGDQIFRTEYNCVKCREPLVKVEEFQVDDMNCPECHGKSLYRDMFVMWD